MHSGDPYGIRTHVIAVKGRCLNHLTKGPHFGSPSRTWTYDNSVNSRVLYRLSYWGIQFLNFCSSRTWTYATHGQKHSRLSHLRSKFSLFLPISCSLLHPPDALAINPVEQPSGILHIYSINIGKTHSHFPNIVVFVAATSYLPGPSPAKYFGHYRA